MIQIQEKILTLSNSRITVLGAGISGIFAAALAGSFNADVVLSDSQKIDLSPEHLSLLKKFNVKLELGGHSDQIFNSTFVVKSPGIPNSTSIIKQLLEKNIPVIGEIEFAYQLLNTNNIVAITGSNGKTTTTSMIAEFLQNTNQPIFCGGNIGNPLSKIVLEETIDDDSIVVLELSSFQLEDICSFRPHIAVFLNISEDHLDRYDDNYDLYFQAKMKIAEYQYENDYFIYYLKDQKLVKNLPENVNCIPFSLDSINNSICIKNDAIQYNYEELTTLNKLKIKGTHNYLNLMAALQVCQLYKLTNDQIYDSIKNFQTPEHRLEFVAEINDVKYYNDSKATNVDSVNMALTAFSGNVILILGGRDKNSNFSLLSKSIQEKVKHLIVTGEASEKIKAQLSDTIKPMVIKNFKEAVEKARSIAVKDDTVLLSPACSSFDAFQNYKERGQYFKELVKGFIRK